MTGTKRQNFEEIVKVLTNSEREDLAEVIRHEIELLDKRAEKAKIAAAKKKENDPLIEIVYAALTNGLSTITEITERINDPEVTKSKVQTRLNKLVLADRAHKEQIKSEGKSHKVMAYCLI